MPSERMFYLERIRLLITQSPETLNANINQFEKKRITYRTNVSRYILQLCLNVSLIFVSLDVGFRTSLFYENFLLLTYMYFMHLEMNEKENIIVSARHYYEILLVKVHSIFKKMWIEYLNYFDCRR